MSKGIKATHAETSSLREQGLSFTETACLRPVAPDNVLVLGQMPGIDGLYIATGGGRQGIMMGPGMGKTIADLIADGTTDVDMSPYDPGRFS